MAAPLRERVWQRAGGRCEYCQLPHDCTRLPHEVDHIRPQKHHGPTAFDNLCLACALCNWHKGSSPVGYDPQTDNVTPLFNPRVDSWSEHFHWDGPRLVGRTAVGRTTIEVLRTNTPERVEHRRLLMLAGKFPPAPA